VSKPKAVAQRSIGYHGQHYRAYPPQSYGYGWHSGWAAYRRWSGMSGGRARLTAKNPARSRKHRGR
jgi:hypothetical protein